MLSLQPHQSHESYWDQDKFRVLSVWMHRIKVPGNAFKTSIHMAAKNMIASSGSHPRTEC